MQKVHSSVIGLRQNCFPGLVPKGQDRDSYSSSQAGMPPVELSSEPLAFDVSDSVEVESPVLSELVTVELVVCRSVVVELPTESDPVAGSAAPVVPVRAESESDSVSPDSSMAHAP